MSPVPTGLLPCDFSSWGLYVLHRSKIRSWDREIPEGPLYRIYKTFWLCLWIWRTLSFFICKPLNSRFHNILTVPWYTHFIFLGGFEVIYNILLLYDIIVFTKIRGRKKVRHWEVSNSVRWLNRVYLTFVPPFFFYGMKELKP